MINMYKFGFVHIILFQAHAIPVSVQFRFQKMNAVTSAEATGPLVFGDLIRHHSAITVKLGAIGGTVWASNFAGTWHDT